MTTCTQTLPEPTIDFEQLDQQARQRLFEELRSDVAVFIAEQASLDECCHLLEEAIIFPVAGGHRDQKRTTITVRDSKDVIAVCNAGQRLCRELGFASVEITQTGTVISKLARTVQKLAAGGEIEVAATTGKPPGIRIVARSHAPGEAALSDMVENSPYIAKMTDQVDVATSPSGQTEVRITKVRR
ncbi:MAG: hypothetical protein ABH877_01495 [bacterium]